MWLEKKKIKKSWRLRRFWNVFLFLLFSPCCSLSCCFSLLIFIDKLRFFCKRIEGFFLSLSETFLSRQEEGGKVNPVGNEWMNSQWEQRQKWDGSWAPPCLNPLLGLHWEGIYLCHWKAGSHICEHIRGQRMPLGSCPGIPWLLLAPFVCRVPNSPWAEPETCSDFRDINKNPLLPPQKPGNCLSAVKNDSIKLADGGFAAVEPGHPTGAPRSVIFTSFLLQSGFWGSCMSLMIFGLSSKAEPASCRFQRRAQDPEQSQKSQEEEEESVLAFPLLLIGTQSSLIVCRARLFILAVPTFPFPLTQGVCPNQFIVQPQNLTDSRDEFRRNSGYCGKVLFVH